MILPDGHMFAGREAGSYEVVLADPPWNYRANSAARPGRNARRHYGVMSLEDIAAMPVRDLVSKNTILWLWITGPFLAIGAHIPIMKSWGFKPSSVGLVWVKLNPRAGKLFIMPGDLHTGLGVTTRHNAEYCLIGKRGRSLRVNKSVHEIVIDNRREHSRKPDQAAERIETYVGPGRKMIELFSRTDRPGWDHWGDQAGTFRSAA